MPSNIASYSARRVGSACVVLTAAAAARPVVRAGGTNVFVSDADAQDGLRCLLGVVTGVARWKVGDTRTVPSESLPWSWCVTAER